MSDEALDQAPAEADKPEVENADTPDWEKQYKALQPEYTRNQQALKDEQSVWEDEQALLARISEKYPHLIADEETDDDDEEFDADDSPDPDVMTKSEFKAWQDEQAQAQALREGQEQFTKDLNRFVGDRELDDKGDAWIKSQTYNGPDDLQTAVNAWFEYLDSHSSKPRKRRPTGPLPGGQTATGVPDYSDMTREQIDQYMADRVRALEAQT